MHNHGEYLRAVREISPRIIQKIVWMVRQNLLSVTMGAEDLGEI